VAYLFDTDAISELLRSRPSPLFVGWVRTIPREDQFISSITAAELYHGAYRSAAAERHLENIEQRVLPAVTTLPFDAATAKIFGNLRATLESLGTPLDDADLQIAATAMYHGLELVTGNIKHFRRIPGLTINMTLAESRDS
jgi:predicted nucleic acid-binding protein